MTEPMDQPAKRLLDPAEIQARHDRLVGRNFFDEIMQIRDEQRQERDNALAVLTEESIPWEINRQGIMRWYMAPTMDDIVMKTYLIYLQRIPGRSRSGKQLTQGGQLCFVWKGGPGYTIVDEERHDWETMDLIQIPRRTAGCVVQHFNDSDEDIEMLVVAPNTIFSAFVDRGSGFEQIEDCPEYREHAANASA